MKEMAGSGVVESSGPPGVTREPMAKVRPGPPVGAATVRARVLGALFGEPSMIGAFGRLRVLEPLGAGGMGVVYEAYDPDLARGVALKLVDVTGKDRETALKEAQALARVSHPNVVPIYDVGIAGDHIYLVMELVRGETLQRWAEGRGVRDIVTVYQQAGAALAAAHDVGLVHRDFKPDNAIVGADGRVRVVDFGLACEADDPARGASEGRRAVGTPRFMAPEIKARKAVTAAADQYSFCVALSESLEVAADASPRRIAGVLARGRAAEAADRFASMHDLLHALARDPARAWRRRTALAGLAVAVGVVMYVVGRQTPSDAAKCDDGGARMEAAWSAAAQASALDRVAALGPYGQSLRPLLDNGIRTHVSRWVREYENACVDRRRRAESEVMSDRRDTCLRRRRDELIVVGQHVGNAAAATLGQLPQAVQQMGDPAQCSDSRALESEIEPPPRTLAGSIARVQFQLTRARIQIGVGRNQEAFAIAADAIIAARSLGYRPLLAEALLAQGHAAMSFDKQQAGPILTEAIDVAMSSHADAMVIEAWARRAYVLGTTTNPDGALAGIDLMLPLADRTASAAFARPLLYNNLGAVELARGHRERARQYLERALAESRKITGMVPPELVAIRFNLALVVDDRTLADRMLVQGINDHTPGVDAEHPAVVMQRLNLQFARGFMTIDDLGQAASTLVPVCRELETRTTLTDRMVACWTEVGLLRAELGDRGEAVAAMKQALRIKPDARDANPYLSLVQDDARTAARQFEAALAAASPTPDDQWWDRYARACLQLGLGRARRSLGDFPGARDALAAAVAALEKLAGDHPYAEYERRLGRARVELALTLSAMHARPEEVAAVAAPARAWLERVGGNRDVLAASSPGGSER